MRNAMQTSSTNPRARILWDLVHGLAATAVTLMRLTDAGRRQEAVTKLNALTDADLRARGLTRSDEVTRIFG